jgi:hypothetical protein
LRLENDMQLVIGGVFSSNIINNVVQGLQFNTRYLMFASWIRTYTNVKNQNEPQTTFKIEFFQQLIWTQNQTCWNLKKKVQNLVWKPKLVVIFKTWCPTIGFYLEIFFSLALPIGKRLCIGVGFGHKILAQTWPIVNVICVILCMHMTNVHVP